MATHAAGHAENAGDHVTRSEPYRLFLTTTARDTPWSPYAHSNFLRLHRAADATRSASVAPANDPDEADAVLFVEPVRAFQLDVLNSAMYRRYAAKSFVIDFRDDPHPVVPGLYAGLRADPTRPPGFQAGYYPRVADNRLFEDFQGVRPPPDLLYSFAGRVANNAAARGPLLELRHAAGIVRDSSTRQTDNDVSYVELLYRSKFVLAPAGHGPSSWRLFEAMRAGRAPVIISDQWVPPGGPDWPAFSVRVAESDIAGIPALLESLEAQSGEMGARAAAAWRQNFSTEGAFAWMGARLREIQVSRGGARPAGPLAAWRAAARARSRIRFARDWLALRTGH